MRYISSISTLSAVKVNLDSIPDPWMLFHRQWKRERVCCWFTTSGGAHLCLCVYCLSGCPRLCTLFADLHVTWQIGRLPARLLSRRGLSLSLRGCRSIMTGIRNPEIQAFLRNFEARNRCSNYSKNYCLQNARERPPRKHLRHSLRRVEWVNGTRLHLGNTLLNGDMGPKRMTPRGKPRL